MKAYKIVLGHIAHPGPGFDNIDDYNGSIYTNKAECEQALKEIKERSRYGSDPDYKFIIREIEI